MRLRFLASALFIVNVCVAAQDTTAIELVFVGDIMQHESQINAAYDPATGRYDYRGLFDRVKPILSSADIAIGNLECTLAGRPYTGYPAFSAPDELLSAIRDAGFDVMVTANNHSVDKGRSGLERTIRLLDSAGLQHTGTFIDTVDYLNEYPLLLERKGIRLSLLNYTYGTNGIRVRKPNIVNMIDTVRIKEDLEKARRQKTDAIIVFLHWGDEYQQQPTDQQRKVAGLCLANGAKLVIGAHPHVLQGMIWDREKDQAVVYSLGNFISGQRVRYRNGGALAHITLEKIRDAQGNSHARLKDVSYSLAWVYRAGNQRRTFELIPIAESLDTAAVKGSTSRSLMMEFINDSRTFLDQENRAVYERSRRKNKD